MLKYVSIYKIAVPQFLIYLQALKEGSWVLLDELNLAPQSVLEVSEQASFISVKLLLC